MITKRTRDERIARPIFDRYFHGGYTTNPERKAKELRREIGHALGSDDLAIEWISKALADRQTTGAK